uniref:Uncharacterized protein n=1 Tax=Nelumbo nucifera TaxID=4432 RepID=A0A822Y0Y3_NELNU|nr:TPA_asm: hypothetical protein HUJ06_027400 [Nelumbo nucifera]
MLDVQEHLQTKQQCIHLERYSSYKVFNHEPTFHNQLNKNNEI